MSQVGEFCAVVPAETFLATSPKVTIDLSVIRVYSDCCVLDITWELYRTTEDPDVWFEHFTSPGSELFQPPDPGEPEPELGRLRYSAVLADGRAFPGHLSAGPHSVSTNNGTASMSLSPLPLPDGLRIRLEWPQFGVHGAVTVLDTAAINRARERVRWL